VRQLFLVVAAASLAAPPTGAIQATSFADCQRLVARRPDDLESYRCYWMIARRTGQSHQALAALDALAVRHGADPRIDLYRAAILGDLGDPAAEGFARKATKGCEALKEWTCATYGHLTLAWHARRAPREARAELAAARRTAMAANDPVLLARADLGLGWRLVAEGDFAAARAAFESALTSLGPGGPFDARISALNGLGYQAWATSRQREALELYRRVAKEAHLAPDPYREAEALYNALFVELEIRRESDPAARPTLAPCEKALEAAERAGNGAVAGWIHLMIAASAVPPGRRDEELALAMELGRSTGVHELLTTALRMRANDEAAAGRLQQAIASATESLAVARAIRDPQQTLWAFQLRGLLRFAAHDVTAARADVAAAMAALDRLLALEPFARDRAGVEARFANGPYAFAHALAREGETELALAVADRFRGRSVLAGLAPEPGGAAVELTEVRRRISRLQRDLFMARGADRPALEGKLRALEQREEAILHGLAPASAGAKPAPSLARLQAALDARTAILSFQLAPEAATDGPAGNSWLAVIDQRRVRTLSVPPPGQLRPAVRAFLGLLHRSDAPERRAAARLGSWLLGEALADLPAGIDRLVIIPDPPLHELPFAALRTAAAGPPLGERYTFERSESLAGWLGRIRARPPALPATAMVLADPVVATPGPAAGPALFRRTVGDVVAPSLPGARREAARLRRELGHAAAVRTGGAATEAAVKRADLRHTGVLYFAAHAWVDSHHPYRTALALASGGGEDGLLQLRDIASLRLGGGIVVLAACNSARGRSFAGEGVFSLARAFLDAGASAVVGTVGDVDDRSAAFVMERLITGLVHGRPLAEALAHARRSALARGLPPAAWASAVLIGDGGVRLKAARPRRFPLPVLGLAAALLLVWIVVWRSTISRG